MNVMIKRFEELYCGIVNPIFNTILNYPFTCLVKVERAKLERAKWERSKWERSKWERGTNCHNRITQHKSRLVTKLMNGKWKNEMIR